MQSLSARRAWIEIFDTPAGTVRLSVALRKESVDRNLEMSVKEGEHPLVALRKESVDRNHPAPVPRRPHADVALRKESVDRNCLPYRNRLPSIPVALRKESVDRNAYGRINDISRLMSLSARRAWIEMVKSSYQDHP